MSVSQQHLSALSRQMGQLSSCFVERERQLAEEAAKTFAMRAAQRVEEELKRGRDVANCVMNMSCLQAVKRRGLVLCTLVRG